MSEHIKTGLAVIGLFYVGGTAVKLFNRHVKRPLERKLTEIFDDEAASTEAWAARQRSKISQRVDAAAREAGRKAFEEAIAGGKTEEEAVQARDVAFTNFVATFVGIYTPAE